VKVAIAPQAPTSGDARVTWTDRPAAELPVVTVVRAPACHFCEDAAAALAELARTFPIRVVTIDVGVAPGAALVRQHQVPMFPLVLLDGAFFSSGRLPRKKLARVLAAARTAAVVA
jgi:hypothetical protein